MAWLAVVALTLSDMLAVLRISAQQDASVGVSNGLQSLMLLLLLTAVAVTVATLRTKLAGPRSLLLPAEALAAMVPILSATTLPLQDPVQRSITYFAAAVFLALLGWDLVRHSRDSRVIQLGSSRP